MKLGMGSALETLCGQAFGAKQLNMLGVYLQRSWVILFTTALLLSPLYIFAAPLLRLIGETPAISEAAGTITYCGLYIFRTMSCTFTWNHLFTQPYRVPICTRFSAT